MDILKPPLRLQEIADRVLRGDVFLYPTDTIAGIGCLASNQDSVERVFAIKARDSTKSISFAFHSQQHLNRYVEIPDHAKSLLSLFPGPLTLILPVKSDSPPLYGISSSSIGVRIPALPWLLDLIKLVDQPIVTTSANISGEQPNPRFSQTDKQITSKIDFAIHWDSSLSSHGSTVVLVESNTVQILREGKIPNEIIHNLVGAHLF